MGRLHYKDSNYFKQGAELFENRVLNLLTRTYHLLFRTMPDKRAANSRISLSTLAFSRDAI